MWLSEQQNKIILITKVSVVVGLIIVLLIVGRLLNPQHDSQFSQEPYSPTQNMHSSFAPSGNVPSPFSHEENINYFSDVGSLPPCGNKQDFFSLSPLAFEDFTYITPLGLLSPTSHVFPSPHLYFNIKRSDPRNYNSLPVEVPVVAPADLTITQIKFIEAKGRPEYNDSMIGFGICRELKAYMDHLKTLSPKIKEVYDQGSVYRCDEYSLTYPQPVGKLDFKLCEKRVNIEIKKGESLGTAGGGEGQKVFDFGGFDKRVTPKQFANSKRWRGREHFVYLICTLDYYSAELKNTLKARLGGYGQKGIVSSPSCGEVLQDVPGTAMGVWVAKGTEVVGHEPPHLALVHENIEPQYLVFSVGDSVFESNLTHGKYTFLPQSKGLVNRHFKDVKSDGQVYCYDTEDLYQANQRIRTSILISMTSPTVLRIAKASSTTCGNGHWQMGKYSEFYR